MKLHQKDQLQLKLHNTLFYLLLIIVVTLLAQLSLKTDISADWTQNNRHTLSDTTIEFLQQLDQDITIQLFISPNDEYKETAERLLSRYQSYSEHIAVQGINPDLSPSLVRELNIQQQGEMVVSRGEQQTHVLDLSEQSLTNALINVSHHKKQWIVFIEGHGERSPFNEANSNLSIWADELQQKGFKLQGLDLVKHSQIPNNTSAVVIASPDRPWLDGEITIIQDYIDQGGHLLWLADPNKHRSLSALAEHLDFTFIDGTVIDPNATLLGINDPRFTLVNDYANHPISQAINTVTLFPHSVALEAIHGVVPSSWNATSLLNTQENTWSTLGEIREQELSNTYFDEGIDFAGPLSIGRLLTRTVENNDGQQRIAIIGDSDFVSNTYIGNAGNLDLGIALINWLVGEDDLIVIPVKTTIDNRLDLSTAQSLIIGLGFLLVLPFLLLMTGFIIWKRRRHR